MFVPYRDLSDMEDEAEVSDVLRLSGRLLVVLMFVTLTKFDTVARIITELVGMLLLVSRAIPFVHAPIPIHIRVH